jgi:ABC-type glycerol-3-phosphate transport system substrate-binding protein
MFWSIKKGTVLKSIISAAFIMPLFLFLGAGCGKGTKKTNEIVIWHWMTDRQDAFEKLAEQYKTKTGITVDFQLYAPSDVYASKVKAAAYTNTLPDVYGILGETIVDFSNFVRSGLVENLTSYMEENKDQWKSCFFEKALSVNEFKSNNEFGVTAGIYGVPIDSTNIQMLYNKKLFEKAGLNPEKHPVSWNEFLADIKQLKDAGIEGLVGGFGETWMLDCLANNYAWNIMGKDKILETIRGNVKYTDPDWLKVFGLFEEMYKNNVIASGSITMINKDAEQSFANERAAFAFNGSWCVNVYSGMNPNLQYAVMLPPKVSDSYPMKVWGGAGSSFVVNAGSKIKPEVIAFLKWLTESEQQAFLAIATNNLPANKNSLKEIPQILSQFADDMDKTVHPRELPVNEFPAVIEAFDKGLQSILIGERTALEMARNVQEIKDRELKRLQNKQTNTY